MAKTFFNRPHHDADHHANFNGVMTSENGLFLYKSSQADEAIKGRLLDYLLLGSGLGFITGASPWLFLPFVYLALALPRKLAGMHYFCFHAELQPHTEQVVFHKADWYGQVKRVHVDIKNLEKINADILPGNQLWKINMFDEDLIFRCAESKEVFVFDRYGLWNKDALEHPLLH